VIAADTSLVVSAFATWHTAHRSALVVLGEGAVIPAHVAVETFSVLTRMPPPHRAPPHVVLEFLTRWFLPTGMLVPSAQLSRDIVGRCVAADIQGGAVYDGLVGLTAAEAGARLMTRDRRAAGSYRKLDLDFKLME
ncbi:MAG: type II toxin-antitoxin system VapC family toxin, partial [Acidimicrobiia bacterium]